MSIKRLGIGFAVAAVMSASAFAADLKSVAEVTPAWRTDLVGTHTTHVPLLTLVPGGQATAIRMNGIRNEQYLDFAVDAEDKVAQLQLQLLFTASPALTPVRSQLNVYLNDQLQATLPIDSGALGKRIERTVSLDPQLVRAQNQIRLQFVGHYQMICETPSSDALWLDLDRASSLQIIKQKVRLANDLSRLPLPLVKTAGPTVLPMVFSTSPNATLKTAAALVAGWTGRTADWRGADFPVYFNEVPAEGHFVVLMTNGTRPTFLKDFPAIEGPMVQITDAPMSRYAKMLIIAGRNDEEVLLAARALVSDDQILIGDKFIVKDSVTLAKRAAYDAPRWVNEKAPVGLNTLMQYPGQLTARGYAPAAVAATMRMAPDLFMVDGGSVNLNLKYRATRPEVGETAQLRVRLNDYLLESVNLAQAATGEVQLKALAFEGPLATKPTDAFTLSQTNQLSFAVDYTRTLAQGTTDNCRSVVMLPHQIEIDPTSIITFKGLYHYAQLPNLALFTQSGFPFTKYADLSESIVVMADGAPAQKVTTLLNTVARMSAATGAVPHGLTVVPTVNAQKAVNKDILIVAESPEAMLDFNADNAQRLQEAVLDLLGDRSLEDADIKSQQGESLFPFTGLGAIVSARSPYNETRTVVALLSEGTAGSSLLNQALNSPGNLSEMTGSVGVLTADRQMTFSVGQTYWVGNLPWYQRLWHTVGQNPLILVACTLVCALLVGAGIFYFMRLWIRRRG